jgi:hypothetical protein
MSTLRLPSIVRLMNSWHKAGQPIVCFAISNKTGVPVQTLVPKCVNDEWEPGQ